MNIVLDIDGTLIDSYKMEIFPRPHLQVFLYFCFRNFETVSIWTAASREWCYKVHNEILKPLVGDHNFHTIFHSDKITECTRQRLDGVSRYKIKNLRKICRGSLTMKNTIIVDDTPITFSRNYGNAVYIKTYHILTDDYELLVTIKRLQFLLKQFNISKNVRNIQRPRWYEECDTYLLQYVNRITENTQIYHAIVHHNV